MMGLDREQYLNDHYIGMGLIVDPTRFRTLLALANISFWETSCGLNRLQVLNVDSKFEDFTTIEGVTAIKCKAFRLEPKGTYVCIDGEVN